MVDSLSPPTQEDQLTFVGFQHHAHTLACRAAGYPQRIEAVGDQLVIVCCSGDREGRVRCRKCLGYLRALKSRNGGSLATASGRPK